MSEIRRYNAILFSPVKKNDTVEISCFTKSRLTSVIPRVRGFLQFYYKNDKFLRPMKLVWEEGGRHIPASPDGVQLLLEKCQRIYLDQELDERLRKDLNQFFNDFKLTKKVISVESCSFCALTKRTTVLKPRDYYNLFDDHYVCRRCAIDEMKKELASKKIQLDTTTFDYAQKILDKTKKVETVVSVFSKGVTNLGEHTLFREIPAEHEVNPLSVADIEVPEKLKQIIIKKRKITSLLPIQALAISAGLLNGKNLLVVASTTSGKTLIGELAGITRILNNKGKMIFCVPLVALANEKFETFRKFYQDLGLRVAIRVGKSRVRVKEEGRIKDDVNVKNSDIIVGTYEGIDFLLRSSPNQLTSVGSVIIDEIQTLDDPERGPILDGLIARLRGLFPNVHLIGLSATVGNPEELADELKMDLVNLEGRPVPLEEHIVVMRNRERKISEIAKIIENEWKIKSKNGFRGQTLCFTNSRRNAHQIANTLHNMRLQVDSYHAGLPFSRRKQVEQDFLRGKLQAVVATFALGAGVDFPASAVIFESLMMGKDVLDPNAFSQMLGRAGRLGKHDRGRVLLLATSDPLSTADTRSELEVAFHLLNAELEPVDLEYDEDYCGDQILAIIASYMRKKITITDIKEIFDLLIGASAGFVQVINFLVKKSLIMLDKPKGPQREVLLTPFGKASTISFFRPSQAISVKRSLQAKQDPLDIALELEPFESIHLSPKLHGYLERTFRTKFGTRLLTGPALDIMDEAQRSDEAGVNLDKWILEMFAFWAKKFFVCRCEERPYCDCGRSKINKEIVRLRIKGLDPVQISITLRRTYEFSAYPGDIFKWLDSILYRLDGIRRISRALNVPLQIGKLIRQIENPKRFNTSQAN